MPERKSLMAAERHISQLQNDLRDRSKDFDRVQAKVQALQEQAAEAERAVLGITAEERAIEADGSISEVAKRIRLSVLAGKRRACTERLHTAVAAVEAAQGEALATDLARDALQLQVYQAGRLADRVGAVRAQEAHEHAVVAQHRAAQRQRGERAAAARAEQKQAALREVC